MVDGDDYYDVVYYDEFLDVEDFKTIRADDPADARETFKDEHYEEDRHEIEDVEHAYTDPDLSQYNL